MKYNNLPECLIGFHHSMRLSNVLKAEHSGWLRLDLAIRSFQRSEKKQSSAQQLRRPLVCGGSAPQFARVPTGKAMGLIFLIRSAPNNSLIHRYRKLKESL
jgi:hypothetical protein